MKGVERFAVMVIMIVFLYGLYGSFCTLFVQDLMQNLLALLIATILGCVFAILGD